MNSELALLAASPPQLNRQIGTPNLNFDIGKRELLAGNRMMANQLDV